MSVEELTGFLKQARSGIRADRYELLKGKVKALLGEHTRTLKEVRNSAARCLIMQVSIV